MDFSNFRETGELSDIRVVVGNEEFLLHKFPLFVKSDFFRALARSPKPEGITLEEFPGGSDVFAEVANFFYNVKLTLNKNNVCQLRCAAEFLQMTSPGNLSSLADRVLQDTLTSAKLGYKFDVITDLITQCQNMGPIAEQAGVVEKCINAIIDCWLMSPKFSRRYTFEGKFSNDDEAIRKLGDFPLDWYKLLCITAREKSIRSTMVANLIQSYILHAVDTMYGNKGKTIQVVSKDVIKDESKEETKDESKEETKEESKEETKEESKDESKDESKKESKDESNDESKDGTKDENKEETEDENKEETENEGKEETENESNKEETEDENKEETEDENKEETENESNKEETEDENKEETEDENKEETKDDSKNRNLDDCNDKLKTEAEDKSSNSDVDLGKVMDALLFEVPLDNPVLMESFCHHWVIEMLPIAHEIGCDSKEVLLILAGKMLYRYKQEDIAVLSAEILSQVIDQGCKNNRSDPEDVCRVLYGYLMDLAEKDKLSIKTFQQLVDSVPKDARVSHDMLFNVLETLLKSDHISVDDKQKQDLLEMVDFSQLSESTLQRANDSGLVPGAYVTKAALTLCSKLRTDLDSAKVIIREQEVRLERYGITPGAGSTWLKTVETGSRYTPSTREGRLKAKSTDIADYDSHLQPLNSQGGRPTTPSLASDYELKMPYDSLDRSFEGTAESVGSTDAAPTPSSSSFAPPTKALHYNSYYTDKSPRENPYTSSYLWNHSYSK